MKPLRIAILWHMHQPDYRDPVAGQTLLPWTYLHAVKDYGEMLKTAAECPAARMTFNIVPTLIEQLDRYCAGEANDHWLELARRDPAGMAPAERSILLSHFFSVHHERHVFPYPKYRELLKRRGEEPQSADFSAQDLRDLQVLFLLAWSGHHLGQNELVKRLRAKGEGFSEPDKLRLFEFYDQEVAGVLELYRQLETAGRIEISVTPYTHPILPLLCGNQIAREACPGTPLPQQSFRHPLDAELQVRYGLQLVRERLGDRTRGMWPAEGAVSEAALKILQRQGAAWVASDEGILHKSLPGGLSSRDQLYRPYSFQGLPILFRDRELSDRIGFVYAHWQPERAARDLLGHLQRAARNAPDGLLPLILDGENCWERYQDNGYPFLRALYQGISTAPELKMVTVGEALTGLQPTPLQRLAPGSWINSDFQIWIGHPEENQAWDLLDTARADSGLEPLIVKALDDPAQPLPEALLHLLRAEGSDWFWWFGDDHVTAQADLFDKLFRRHLEALYQSVGKTAPEALSRPIKPPRFKQTIVEPRVCFTPKIDGQISDYFEWLGAGHADLKSTGAMHGASELFSTLYFGYDHQHFYLRIDPLVSLQLQADQRLELRLETSTAWRLLLDAQKPHAKLIDKETGSVVADCPAAVGKVIEIALPLAALDLVPGDPLQCALLLLDANNELARWPAESNLSLPYRGKLLEADSWSL
ncbi:MAG TPA: glycoside hydrolase family 57 protein [Geothermobacteraceae bacterium]|nr:glycoside hydrolase family 57 protein [Geothermobacteraceae bacterium]